MDIREKIECMTEPLHCIMKATLMTIKEDGLYYLACPCKLGECQCNKKLSKEIDEKWIYTKCNVSHFEYDYRHLLQMKIEDYTDTMWAIVFDDVATQLLDVTTKELYLIDSSGEDDNYARRFISDPLKKDYLFSLICKKETYNKTNQLKATVEQIKLVDFVAENDNLLTKIGNLSSNSHIQG